MHSLWSRWAPPLERTKLVTIAYSGSYFGTVISMAVCGLLAEHLGWASIFYVSGEFHLFALFTFFNEHSCFAGTFAVLWYVLWFVLVKESPEDDRFISQSELNYLRACIGPLTKKNVSYFSLRLLSFKVILWSRFFRHWLCRGDRSCSHYQFGQQLSLISRKTGVFTLF